jgi:hypothetical protein
VIESESHPIAAWHAIVAARDPAGLESLLASDVIFYSPVVHAPQMGRDITLKYLRAALRVFLNDSFRYVRDIVGINDAMLEFVVEIDGIIVNGVDIIRWNEQAQITEFKVMLRPLKAVNLIHEKMSAMLESSAAQKR